MSINCLSTIKQEDFRNDFKLNNEDHFDTYLYDSNLSVPAMVEKYDVPMSNINKLDEKKNEKKNLRCIVCGANAFGYNFDQITCESCKAFFRRNALKNVIDLQCRFAGNCNVTVENRRHCTHCRIKKCFSVGMRKEWIRSEEEKHIKRMQLERSRNIKQSKRPLQMPILRQAGQFNLISILSSTDRMRLNNITHCYDQYTGEPSISKYLAPQGVLSLRLHDFYNRKKPIVINFISYFKHLPEFQELNLDDQVLLIKQNIRVLLPLNYALLKTPIHSQFRYTQIKTIGCIDNMNLHSMYTFLSNSFVPFVTLDPLIIKVLLIILFFTTNSQSTDIDAIEYKQLEQIKRIQSSYIELLWLYMIEKYGEDKARNLFTNIITKFLHLQIMIGQIDSIVHLNNDIQYVDVLMKSILQLT